MSTHGACFDEGQSGNCGWDCSAFLEGECSIADEFADGGEYLDDEKLLILDEVYGIVPEKTIQPPDPFKGDDTDKYFLFDKFTIDT